MLGAFRTYRWIPGLTAALLLLSSALPLVALACLHCDMPGDEAAMHAEAMPCPEMAAAAPMPRLGEACAMSVAAAGCCAMPAPAPAPSLRTLAETTPQPSALLLAFDLSTAPRLDAPAPALLPPRAKVPIALGISISLLISSLRN